MIDLTFLFSITDDGIEVASVDIPDEYRVALGFFQDQRPELFLDEAQVIYDFLAGYSYDWRGAEMALMQSKVYDWEVIATYLPDTTGPATPDEVRQAIISYALETFTAFMLQQPDPHSE